MNSDIKRNKKIILLSDNIGYLCSSLKGKNGTGNVTKIKQLLIDDGWEVRTIRYDQLSLSSEYSGYYVFYASSEDSGLFYKDYIEDWLLWLKRTGNILLPEFDFFRAHHNKAYMEMLRGTFQNNDMNTIHTFVFSGVKEVQEYLKTNSLKYPVVVKSSAGAGSKGVGLAQNSEQLLSLGKRFERRFYFDYYSNFWRSLPMQKLRNFYRILRGREKVNYKRKTGKFIVQNFINGLKNDYKVLIFGHKYFVLKRLNRKNDFRASGSGKFEFPGNYAELSGILNFAKNIKETLKQPMLSLDIAYDGTQYHLIEFQCVSFGPYTLQHSSWYFIEKDKQWKKVNAVSELEENVVYALNQYVEELGSN